MLVGREKAGLPNAVRERLLGAQKSTVTARLLDILLLDRWEPESFFTLREAMAVGARFGLNRKSILQALTGDRCSFNGRHIISRRYVEYLDNGGLNLRKRGRPVELVFQVPSVARLLWVLNVGLTPSDRMVAEDVRSARSYRLAVHREYIKRLSPEATNKVLGDRVGVNVRTVTRYSSLLGVAVTSFVGRFRLTRDWVAVLPTRRREQRKNSTNGYWLENDDGARFPAWRHVGLHLLKRGGDAIYVCMRRMSRFSLGWRACSSVEYQKLTVAEFLRGRVLRGEDVGAGSVVDRVKDLFSKLRKRVGAVRYDGVQLSFDSVSERVADDKVADSISGYLYAFDEGGGQVRRPARRGIAYRMLKEFGDGNVFLALRDSYRDVMVRLGELALNAGDLTAASGLASQSLGQGQSW